MALAGVDGLALHKRVGVEHLGAGAHAVGVHKGAHGVERGSAGDVGLSRVEPPGVDPLAEHLAAQLLPEQLGGVGIEKVDERPRVAPAVYAEQVMAGEHLLVVVVGLGFFADPSPDGDHQVGMQIVNRLGPGGRVGIARGVKRP